MRTTLNVIIDKCLMQNVDIIIINIIFTFSLDNFISI